MSTNKVLCIRPASFAFDPETGETNAFQQNDSSMSPKELQAAPVCEFNNFVNILESKGIDVAVVDDTPEPVKPNAVFPNNWVTFHTASNKAILYPMCAKSRRSERRRDILPMVIDLACLKKLEVIDLSAYEDKEMYLEGTGSMVLDHLNKVIYACLSKRTHPTVLQEVGKILGYEVIPFRARDANSTDIYHTNVMMSIANQYVVICSECISSTSESIPISVLQTSNNNDINTSMIRLYSRDEVLAKLQSTHRVIIEITLDQMCQYAGNMLEIINKRGNSVLALSQSAFACLNKEQLAQLQKFSELAVIPIPVIEKYGGGSIRCMLCEIR